MSILKKKAKELSIEVWQYFVDNPRVDSKHLMPHELFKKVESFPENCPLCARFYTHPRCKKECPLYNDDENDRICDKSYYGWRDATTKKERKLHAKIILDKIKAWDIKKKAKNV